MEICSTYFCVFAIHKSNQRKQKSHRHHSPYDTTGRQWEAGQEMVEQRTLEGNYHGGAVGLYLRFIQLQGRVSKKQCMRRGDHQS